MPSASGRPRSSRTHCDAAHQRSGLPQRCVGHDQVERRVGLAQQLADQEGVPLVVLDEQDAQPFGQWPGAEPAGDACGARPTVQSCRNPTRLIRA